MEGSECKEGPWVSVGEGSSSGRTEARTQADRGRSCQSRLHPAGRCVSPHAPLLHPHGDDRVWVDAARCRPRRLLVAAAAAGAAVLGRGGLHQEAVLVVRLPAAVGAAACGAARVGRQRVSACGRGRRPARCTMPAAACMRPPLHALPPHPLPAAPATAPSRPLPTCGHRRYVGNAAQAQRGGGVKPARLEARVAVPHAQVVGCLARRHAAAGGGRGEAQG